MPATKTSDVRCKIHRVLSSRPAIIKQVRLVNSLESVWWRLKIANGKSDIKFQCQSSLDVATEVFQLNCQKDTSDSTKPVGDTVKNTSLALKIFFCGKCNSEIKKKHIYVYQNQTGQVCGGKTLRARGCELSAKTLKYMNKETTDRTSVLRTRS